MPASDLLKLFRPKVYKFNEFFRIHPDEFSDFQMWHWFPKKASKERERSTNYAPGRIPEGRIASGFFICFGKCQRLDHYDLDLILDDFDRLLYLYKFVEGKVTFPTVDSAERFHFTPGCSLKPSLTTASIPAQQLNVLQRHNDLQLALYNCLRMGPGEIEVGTEQGTGSGTRIDLVVLRDGQYWFYEIKSFGSARACIREALSQLLEYSYWPKAQAAERLIIVGEPPLDNESDAYLCSLRKQFKLPVYYQQFILNEGRLVESA